MLRQILIRERTLEMDVQKDAKDTKKENHINMNKEKDIKYLESLLEKKISFSKEWKSTTGYKTLGGFTLGEQITREVYNENFEPYELSGVIRVLEKVEGNNHSFIRVYLNNHRYFVVPM